MGKLEGVNYQSQLSQKWKIRLVSFDEDMACLIELFPHYEEERIYQQEVFSSTYRGRDDKKLGRNQPELSLEGENFPWRQCLRDFLYKLEEDDIRYEVCDAITDKIKRDEIKKISEYRKMVDKLLDYFENQEPPFIKLATTVKIKHKEKFEKHILKFQVILSEGINEFE